MMSRRSYWTYATPEGDFSIVERHGRGVDLFFGSTFLAHCRNPVSAAMQVADGDHPLLSCAPADGKSLGVPAAVHNWTYVRP